MLFNKCQKENVVYNVQLKRIRKKKCSTLIFTFLKQRLSKICNMPQLRVEVYD